VAPTRLSLVDESVIFPLSTACPSTVLLMIANKISRFIFIRLMVGGTSIRKAEVIHFRFKRK
jgi:hypothetical protein